MFEDLYTEINQKNMSFAQLGSLSGYIDQHHSAGKMMGAKIKYLETTIDFRTNSIFRVELRGFRGDKHFYTSNEGQELGPLYNRIMEWLKGFEGSE